MKVKHGQCKLDIVGPIARVQTLRRQHAFHHEKLKHALHTFVRQKIDLRLVDIGKGAADIHASPLQTMRAQMREDAGQHGRSPHVLFSLKQMKQGGESASKRIVRKVDQPLGCGTHDLVALTGQSTETIPV